MPTEEQETQYIEQLRTALNPEVDAQLRQSGEEGCTEPLLRRWLVARKWKVDSAAKDLTDHAKWRIKYVPNGEIAEVLRPSFALPVLDWLSRKCGLSCFGAGATACIPDYPSCWRATLWLMSIHGLFRGCSSDATSSSGSDSVNMP